MNPPAPYQQPSPQQASLILDQLLQMVTTLLERWMSSPASTFQEQALRSLLPQFLPSLEAELRKEPVKVIQVLAFIHVMLGELLTDPSTPGAHQLLLIQLAELGQPNGHQQPE